ncbi:MAG: hypothetical protein COT81_00530 [Candidatus Buchananbacteria bacterium CG10_big_fil_rev_8_21_14_0_10_42_9]|uniref:DUF3784 domain-containing protein n=1 Tax=Candidatus Buchananbacteria bacterium CG10_big_fil_rev_8_21_14_0_10_42_9 TaxID=1974526 RepID=A0A2H0W2F7_9BACT|nr:MAG: hypothetical protein COT81_00530 [Candidatus Buchananbacteria bacterium CG10_big_fil_rev_8_21_14_0_10_42_9]
MIQIIFGDHADIIFFSPELQFLFYLSLILAGLLFTTGILFIFSDRKKIIARREAGEESANQRFNGWAEMKHDAAIYFGTFLVVIVPTITNDPFRLTDLLQVIIAFALLIYTKRLYWKKQKSNQIL